MRFTLSDGQDSIAILYRGVVPNNFKPGDKVVVDGEYTAAGIFEACSIGSQSSPLCQVCH